MKTTKEILKAARDILARPLGWSAGHRARTGGPNGESVGYNDSRADCFCDTGAIRRSLLGDGQRFLVESDLIMLDEVLDVFDKHIPSNYFNLECFNDSQDSVEPVLALFDKALTGPTAVLA